MKSRLEQLYEFLEESPEDPFLHYAISSELLKKGDTDLALTGYQQLIQRFPDYQGTYYHLGKLYERLGRTDDAVTTYEAGMHIALKGRNQHAYGELASALASLQGEEDE